MKNESKKIKSIVMICLMLFSAMTAVVLMNNSVQAIPTAFTLNTPATGTIYDQTVTTSVNISWGKSNVSHHDMFYRISINGVAQQNFSAANTSHVGLFYCYNWTITTVTPGAAYTINVSAYNASTVAPKRRYATGNNKTVYVVHGTPGVTTWGDATTELKYNVGYASESIIINTSKWATNATYYLYYPTYKCNGTLPQAYLFSWDGPYAVGGFTVTLAATTANTHLAGKDKLTSPGGDIKFNRSGMWIFDDVAAAHSGDVPSTFAGYIWVNTTTNFTINSVTDINYGDSGTKTFSVTGSNGCNIAIMDPDNHTIYNEYLSTGQTLPIGVDNFTKAGDYTIKAYTDLDVITSTNIYHDVIITSDYQNYSAYYGSGSGDFPTCPSTHAEKYIYAVVGPWDPPEMNATGITFTVNTGEPIITLTNTTDIYWGYKTRIDVNVTDSSGKGINLTKAQTKLSLKLRKGTTYYDYTDVWINNTAAAPEKQKPGNYSIEIPRIPALNWSYLGANANGTWRVVFGYDAPTADGTYEWNNTESFVVKSATPPVQLVIVNDGSGTATDKKVDVPAYIYNGAAKTIAIAFDIFGTSISDNQGRAYYGDDTTPVEDWKNITVEGDILYPVNATTLVHSTLGRWTATVTPTKPGGTITITIDWPGSNNGTATQTIDIVNGTFVTSAVDSFAVGADYNLTVTVKDMDGDPVKNANVAIMWEDSNTKYNITNGTNVAGNGLNGEYTFWINPDDATYPTTAPQNLTVAAKWYTGFWGYTKVVMEKDHNMQVNITPTTSYAGDATLYDINVDLAGGGHPATTGLNLAVYNSTGALVTGDDAWSKLADYSLTDEEIILSGGTYYLYAYNATHDSRGNNATLIVTPYTVTSSPSVLAWKIDEAVNMTFQVTPAGNGTLTIENMSSLPNCSYLNQDSQIDIVDGSGTLDEVNATTLGNVTFSYTPEGGDARHADGLLRVTTATATSSPATIYTGEATSVTITITHPATGVALQGVEVGLDHDLNATTTILSKLPTNLFTNAAGTVTFAITAETSGNVTIFIENETDPDNEFVIVAEARKPMVISTDVPAVNEGATFTVEAKSGGVLITDATVTITFAGSTNTTTTGTKTLTAPKVSTSLDYTITATADGYTDATVTIKVLNVPKLTIIPPSGKVYGTKEFTVTVAEDSGNAVIGAKVTFNGADYYTGAGGLVTLTAPDVKETSKNYTLTATFTGFESAAPVTLKIYKTQGGIPGFELVTLMAAIGVALILLRRRRN